MHHSTYQKLVVAAASLFRQKGYAATAIADILDLADTPKGSLYHHFPGGKHDLAIAAAKWSSQQVLEMINAAFEETQRNGGSFIDGATAICLDLADIFETKSRWDFSPVTTMFVDGASHDKFRTTAQSILIEWEKAFLQHSEKFGISKDQARHTGNKLLMLLEGAWALSRALDSAAPIRQAALFIKET